MLKQIFLVTRCGLVLPVFGLMLGIGVAWSLASVLGDPSEEWAGTLRKIETMKEAFSLVKTTSWCVLRNSWRNALVVGLAGVISWAMVHPGPGVCDPNATHYDAKCAKGDAAHPAHPLKAVPYRAAGLVPVIL